MAHAFPVGCEKARPVSIYRVTYANSHHYFDVLRWSNGGITYETSRGRGQEYGGANTATQPYESGHQVRDWPPEAGRILGEFADRKDDNGMWVKEYGSDGFMLSKVALLWSDLPSPNAQDTD